MTRKCFSSRYNSHQETIDTGGDITALNPRLKMVNEGISFCCTTSTSANDDILNVLSIKAYAHMHMHVCMCVGVFGSEAQQLFSFAEDFLCRTCLLATVNR